MATRMSIANAGRKSRQPQAGCQDAVIAAVDDCGPMTRRYTLESPSGAPLASFRAGSSIPVLMNMGGTVVAYRYAIASSPRDAKRGKYRIVVKRGAGGYASTHIFDTWAAGDQVSLGMPAEDDALSRLNDGDELIAVAGSVGVVPFRSIAQAIAEGDADFHLTLFYSADSVDDLLFREEWPLLEKQSDGRLSVVPVIADEGSEGCEHGPVTRALIGRYADISKATFLIRGPATLVAAMRMELAPLKLSRRRLRSAFSGDTEARPVDLDDATHQIAIHMGGKTRTVTARGNETVLEALEKAGLQPPADCRTGICGYCHTTLLSGEFILATDEAAERRMHDRSSFFHPCCSYPVSNMEIVVRRERT